ncbi:MAG: PKD domain-containing protein, partial [Thermoanaerobaculales bacterium]
MMKRVGLVAVLAVTLGSRAVLAQFAQQGGKLAGSGATGNAWQGSAVAVSADGSTALVGGYLDNGAAGATWVFTRSGGAWAQQGDKLVGTGATGSAQQGWAVAISGDGNTALIGGPADNSGAGAAWVFTRSGGAWSQQGNKLVGSGAGGNAGQGRSVAISSDGNTAVVGGPGDNNSNFVGAGAIWVFTRTGGTWKQQGNKVVTTTATGPASLGWSVAISGDATTMIAGGPHDNGRTGAVWVFTQAGGKWTQQGNKLVGTAPTTLFTISANASATAAFTQQPPPCAAFVTASNPSNGGDVNLITPRTCTNGFLPGTQVSLTAVPSTGWSFAGWSGTGGWFTSPSTATTTFTVAGAATVTAHFVKQNTNCLTLTVATSPTDAGTTTIGTSLNCIPGYTQGTPILLTASPAAGWQFAGWSSAAGMFSTTTSPTTVFVIEANATVTATFVQVSTACETLAVASSPANAGSVSVITPQDCSGGFTKGTQIWLTSAPAPGWTLSGWSGSGGSFSDPIGAVADALQGTTLALSADGNTAVVGGVMSASSSRSVWVFARSNGTWVQQGNQLATSGGAGLGQQVWSVACSGDGNTVVVAEPGDNVGTGAAWVFTRSAGVFAPSGSKLIGTGATGTAEQGAAVALSADAGTIVVGGPNDGGGAGAVWVFAQGATPACTFALSPTSLGFSANGGRGNVAVAVTTGSSCPWVAVSNAPWIAITAGPAGTDAGQVNLAVSGNAGVARSGTLTIANQTLTVYQAGTDCSYSLSPTSASFTATGGTSTFTVTTPAQCPWAATSSATWLHVTGGATGLGTGTVTFAVDASTGAARAAVITVADQSFAVSEGAYVPPVLAGFTAAPASPVVGEPVQFTDTSTGAPISWTWDFGDGTASNLQNPSHTYAAPGTFTVTLTAANVANQGTSSSQVTVGAGFVSWLPVVSHSNGSGGSVWRSDVGVLNPSA